VAGIVNVILHRVRDGQSWKLVVDDNGKGIPRGCQKKDWARALCVCLVQQVGGTMTRAAGNPGLLALELVEDTAGRNPWGLLAIEAKLGTSTPFEASTVLETERIPHPFPRENT